MLADALPASEEVERLADAQEALEKGTAAAEATGAYAELPLIEQIRERVGSLAADGADA